MAESSLNPPNLSQAEKGFMTWHGPDFQSPYQSIAERWMEIVFLGNTIHDHGERFQAQAR